MVTNPWLGFSLSRCPCPPKVPSAWAHPLLSLGSSLGISEESLLHILHFLPSMLLLSYNVPVAAPQAVSLGD